MRGPKKPYCPEPCALRSGDAGDLPPLEDVPSWLGDFRSANLAHPERGVRGLSDGQIARTIRTGVLPDGHLSPVMNSFGKIGDRDVAAILGYIRSGAEVFEAKGPSEIQPRTTLSLAGAMIITYVSKISVNAPSSGIEVPPKAPTVAYGRYMVAVLDCATCHTDGFSDDKMNQPGAFAGGFERRGRLNISGRCRLQGERSRPRKGHLHAVFDRPPQRLGPPSPITMLHHTSWQVDDIDEVGRGATAMLAKAPGRHVWGLGRHHLGSNFFWYLKDPAGNFSEY